MGLTAYYFPDVYQTSERDSQTWDVTTSICRDIADEFASHETPVFFVLLPSSYLVYEKLLEDYANWFKIDSATVDVDQPNKALAARFAAAGLTLEDPLEHLRAESNGREALYGSVDTHLSERGHREVAGFLLPAVEGFLSRSVLSGSKGAAEDRR
jgi:hypothetical protein